MTGIGCRPRAISKVTYASLSAGSIESVSMFVSSIPSPESATYNYLAGEDPIVFEATVGTLLTRRYRTGRGEHAES